MKHVCSIDGCGRPYYCAGLCASHYQRVRLSGGHVLQPDARIENARAMLKDRPMSVQQLADALRVSKPTAQHVIKELGAAVLFTAHINTVHGTPSPIYSCVRNDASHALSLLHKRMCEREELSGKELALLCGINQSSTRKYLAYLHSAGLVHIARWTLVKQRYERLWKFGPGTDAPKPQPQPRWQIAQNQALRQKLDPEQAENRRSIMRRSYLLHHAKPKRDPLVVALFGKAA